MVSVIKGVNNSLQTEVRKQREKQKGTERELKGLLSHVLMRMKN